MTLKGGDFSAWQTVLPPLAGNSFAFVKATEGVSYVSPAYAHQAAGVKAAGLVLIPYHFGVMTSGTAQAAHFLTVAGRDSQIVLLDIETPPKISPADSRLFIAACRSAGKTVGTYASVSSFPMKLGQDFTFVAYPDGHGAPPPVRCEFWQRQSGVAGGDYFSGTLADLKKLAQIAVPGPAPVAHTLHIAHGAKVGYPVVTEPSPGEFRAGKPVTILTWTGPDTALPCSAPYYDKAAKTTLVHVAKGLPHTWVHAVGPGISVTHS